MNFEIAFSVSVILLHQFSNSMGNCVKAQRSASSSLDVQKSSPLSPLSLSAVLSAPIAVASPLSSVAASVSSSSTAATASTSKNDDQNGPRFMNAAGRQFENFYDQAVTQVNHFLPNWNNWNNPHGYFIPPAFEFKKPDV